MDEKMINYGTGNSPRRKRRRVNYGRVFALLVVFVAVIALFIALVVSVVKGITGEDTSKEKQNEVKVETVEVLVKPWETMDDTETISNLSGLPIKKEEAQKRPVAIMYHNRLDTLPQAGLSNAEIVYEVPTEGEVVALLGVFQDLSQATYGPIRSIRKNVIGYSFDNDAILVHYKSGEVANYGTGIAQALKSLNSANIDAGSYEAEMTKDVVISAGTIQSQATTSSEEKVTTENQTVKFVTRDGIISTWAKKGYKTLREADKQVKLFKFGLSDETELDYKANVVTIEYSWYQTSEFRYDAKAKVYKRFQTIGNTEMQQMDSMGTTEEYDDEALEYKNVIIEYVESKNGDIAIAGAGEGLYITNGTYMPIKWSKADEYEPTVYTDLAGNEIELNRGRTWIAVVPNTIEAKISEEVKDTGKTSSRVVYKSVTKNAMDIREDNNELGTIAGIDTMPNAAKK